MTHKNFVKWLNRHNACGSGIAYIKRNKFTAKQFWDTTTMAYYKLWLARNVGGYKVARRKMNLALDNKFVGIRWQREALKLMKAWPLPKQFRGAPRAKRATKIVVEAPVVRAAPAVRVDVATA